MADKQLVPYNHAAKTLATIEPEPTPLAVIPPPDLEPPARGIPKPKAPRRPRLPPPEGSHQAYFAQPIDHAREERMHRWEELKKPIHIPS
jgi:hypothetical protein